MLDIVIYHLHIVGFLYAFTRRWQEDGLKGGFLALSICALVFVIGWSLTGTIARMVMDAPTTPTWFTPDTLSLVMLLIPETAFFWMFFVREQRAVKGQGMTTAS